VAKRPGFKRRISALVLAFGVAGGLGACAPVHTLDLFDPSDGVGADLEGEVKATNLLILTEGQGEQGTLVGSLTNLTYDPLTVEVEVEDAEVITVDLSPQQTAYLTPGEPKFDNRTIAVDALVNSVAAPPGSTADVTLTTPSGGAINVDVPVLDGSIEPYDQFLPE